MYAARKPEYHTAGKSTSYDTQPESGLRCQYMAMGKGNEAQQTMAFKRR